MRKINLLLAFAVVSQVALGQTSFENNGLNLKDYCEAGECIYFKFKNVMLHPMDSESPDWQLANMEVAVKRSGSYIVTGDMAVMGEEMGAKLNFKLTLFDGDDQVVFEKETGLFEFFSEPNKAEPIVFYGELDQEIAQKVDYMDFTVVESDVVPYYELSSDCYGPCKTYQLNASIKEFKKQK